MIYLVCLLNPLGDGRGPREWGEEDFAPNEAVHKYFRRRGDAENFAQDWAKKNPGKTVAIFHPQNVYETTQPAIIEKMFNEAGELVPRKV